MLVSAVWEKAWLLELLESFLSPTIPERIRCRWSIDSLHATRLSAALYISPKCPVRIMGFRCDAPVA